MHRIHRSKTYTHSGCTYMKVTKKLFLFGLQTPSTAPKVAPKHTEMLPGTPVQGAKTEEISRFDPAFGGIQKAHFFDSLFAAIFFPFRLPKWLSRGQKTPNILETDSPSTEMAILENEHLAYTKHSFSRGKGFINIPKAG